MFASAEEFQFLIFIIIQSFLDLFMTKRIESIIFHFKSHLLKTEIYVGKIQMEWKIIFFSHYKKVKWYASILDLVCWDCLRTSWNICLEVPSWIRRHNSMWCDSYCISTFSIRISFQPLWFWQQFFLLQKHSNSHCL